MSRCGRQCAGFEDEREKHDCEKGGSADEGVRDVQIEERTRPQRTEDSAAAHVHIGVTHDRAVTSVCVPADPGENRWFEAGVTRDEEAQRGGE